MTSRFRFMRVHFSHLIIQACSLYDRLTKRRMSVSNRLSLLNFYRDLLAEFVRFKNCSAAYVNSTESRISSDTFSTFSGDDCGTVTLL